MRPIIPILVVAMLAIPLQGGITSLVQPEAGSADCGAFTETTWDNLTGWTQDTNVEYSANATNDNLDIADSGTGIWIQNDTDTTNANHCAMWQYKVIPGSEDMITIMLRAPSGVGNVYVVGYAFQSSDLFWMTYATNNNGVSWVADNASGGGVSAPDAGDYISACVTGTGTGTVITYWDHGASDPGDCRSDWGAADVTYLDDPSTAVDSNTRVGILLDEWTGVRGSGGELDEFVGSDY